ncbi:MAG: bifunctional 2-polyprenyl-6-hydroxyphenol methylase/3-demethylubiquinol 3-O-methyltransferase UbiG [Pseudomonadota bacterium]
MTDTAPSPAAPERDTSQAQAVDPAEIAKFEAMAAEWWNPEGMFKPLHMLNPCRLQYITDQIAAQHGRDLGKEHAFDGLRLLDIGCGGGLLCEPMTRLGAEVVGVDPAARNIPVARLHAEQMGLEIDYRVSTAEDLLAQGESFDAVLNMEVVEHVPDPQAYITACAGLLRPGGVMITSTINRNPKSYAMAIIGAEYVMRWLPKGTHEWSKFITPSELCDMLESAGLDSVDRTGFVFNPLTWSWRLSSRDLSVNYTTAATRAATG